jgi:hypothetical protein
MTRKIKIARVNERERKGENYSKYLRGRESLSFLASFSS